MKMRSARRSGGMMLIAGLVTAALVVPAAAAMGQAPARPESAPPAAIDFRQVVQKAKDRVFPAVVFIRCLTESHDAGKKVTQEVSGSGVLVSPDGEVLTNWHVIDKAAEVRCLLYDGTHYHADILGSDKDTDLALIRLRREEGAAALPHATLADSNLLTEGDFVMAMGAPWGMSRSVTIGIISSVRRYLPENSEYSLWLQTDAAISPGNSGGPLVNTEGEVVGINTRGVMAGGDMGFSVPSNTIALLLPRLRESGQVQWSWTGLHLQPLRDFNRNMYFEGTHGVIVSGAEPDSPARRAGIEARDRLVEINGVCVAAVTEEDLPEIRRMLGLLPENAPTPIVVERGGERLALELTPRDKGRVEGEELDCPRWDLTVKAINQFDNPDLHFHRRQGVFILATRYPGNAGTAGLRAQDILLKVDDREITTLDDVREVHAQSLKQLPGKRRLMVTVLRNGQERLVVLDIARDFERR